MHPPSRAETTVDGGSGKRMTVTPLEPSDDKTRLTAWCWQFVSRFAPSIKGKNVVCLVKNGDGRLPATTS